MLSNLLPVIMFVYVRVVVYDSSFVVGFFLLGGNILFDLGVWVL